MKNINFKKYLITVIVILLIPFVLNYFAFLYVCTITKTKLFSYQVLPRENFSQEEFMSEYFYFDSPQNISKKPPIMLFGCGMASGDRIKNGKTLDTILSNYTKRTVYNRAISSGYIQHALAQVESHEIDDLIKQSSHAIYLLPSFRDATKLKVYPGNVLDANYLLDEILYLKYTKDSNGKLKQYISKHPVITGSVLYRLIEKILNQSVDYKLLKFQTLHFKQLNENLKSINPNIKLYILIYYDDYKDIKHYASLVNKLKSYGIEILELSRLSDLDLDKPPYSIDNSNDPSSKAWEVLVPKIAKELKL